MDLKIIKKMISFNKFIIIISLICLVLPFGLYYYSQSQELKLFLKVITYQIILTIFVAIVNLYYIRKLLKDK